MKIIVFHEFIIVLFLNSYDKKKRMYSELNIHKKVPADKLISTIYSLDSLILSGKEGGIEAPQVRPGDPNHPKYPVLSFIEFSK